MQAEASRAQRAGQDGARASVRRPGERLIVALDVPTIGEAEALSDRLSPLDPVLKIGHQLAFTGGLDLARRLAREGRRVFLDMKLHDIPRTVEEGARALSGLGATFLTVHAYPQTMRAAAAGAAGSGLTILGVTILTSMDDEDARRAGYGAPVAALVEARARDALEAGIGGLVCAATELAALRPIVGGRLDLVVPGIRPAGAPAGDQKRVMTPGEAIAAGAGYLVVGRPVAQAKDPLEAAQAIVAEMEAAA